MVATHLAVTRGLARRWRLALLCWVAVAGCAGPGPQRPAAPVQERGSDGVVETDAVGTSGAVGPSSRAPNSAVVALRREAEREAVVGRLDRSAALLERALRVDPRDPALWHALARVRLKQNRYGLAESLALKSIRYAGGDDALRAANWRLIARARAAGGDGDGARRARDQAEALQ